jgi:hypothetical protein
MPSPKCYLLRRPAGTRLVCLVIGVSLLVGSQAILFQSAEASTLVGARSGKVAATVVALQGTSLIRSEVGGKPAPAHPIKVGEKVYEGDVINTPSNGQVKLMMLDKTIMDIGKSALFKIKQFENNNGLDRQVDVSMMYGSIRAVVTQPIKGKGSFKVRTASSTMGVRGTEFVVKSEMGDMKSMASAIKNPGSAPPPVPEKGAPVAKTEVTVVQGKVDVEPPKPKDSGRGPAAAKAQIVSLTAGSQLTTSTADAAPPKPVTLNTQQLSEVKSAVKVEDNTFSKAIVLDMGSNSGSANGNSSGSNGGSGGSTIGGGSGAGGAGGALDSAGGGGVANITASIIADTVAAPPASIAAPISAANAGFAGTINAGNILSGPPAVNLTAGGLRRIKIILVR